MPSKIHFDGRKITPAQALPQAHRIKAYSRTWSFIETGKTRREFLNEHDTLHAVCKWTVRIGVFVSLGLPLIGLKAVDALDNLRLKIIGGDAFSQGRDKVINAFARAVNQKTADRYDNYKTANKSELAKKQLEHKAETVIKDWAALVGQEFKKIKSKPELVKYCDAVLDNIRKSPLFKEKLTKKSEQQKLLATVRAALYKEMIKHLGTALVSHPKKVHHLRDAMRKFVARDFAEDMNEVEDNLRAVIKRKYSKKERQEAFKAIDRAVKSKVSKEYKHTKKQSVIRGKLEKELASLQKQEKQIQKKRAKFTKELNELMADKLKDKEAKKYHVSKKESFSDVEDKVSKAKKDKHLKHHKRTTTRIDKVLRQIKKADKKLDRISDRIENKTEKLAKLPKHKSRKQIRKAVNNDKSLAKHLIKKYKTEITRSSSGSDTDSSSTKRKKGHSVHITDPVRHDPKSTTETESSDHSTTPSKQSSRHTSPNVTTDDESITSRVSVRSSKVATPVSSKAATPVVTDAESSEADDTDGAPGGDDLGNGVVPRLDLTKINQRAGSSREETEESTSSEETDSSSSTEDNSTPRNGTAVKANSDDDRAVRSRKAGKGDERLRKGWGSDDDKTAVLPISFPKRSGGGAVLPVGGNGSIGIPESSSSSSDDDSSDSEPSDTLSDNDAAADVLKDLADVVANLTQKVDAKKASSSSSESDEDLTTGKTLLELERSRREIERKVLLIANEVPDDDSDDNVTYQVKDPKDQKKLIRLSRKLNEVAIKINNFEDNSLADAIDSSSDTESDEVSVRLESDEDLTTGKTPAELKTLQKQIKTAIRQIADEDSEEDSDGHVTYRVKDDGDDAELRSLLRKKGRVDAAIVPEIKVTPAADENEDSADDESVQSDSDSSSSSTSTVKNPSGSSSESDEDLTGKKLHELQTRYQELEAAILQIANEVPDEDSDDNVTYQAKDPKDQKKLISLSRKQNKVAIKINNFEEDPEDNPPLLTSKKSKSSSSSSSESDVDDAVNNLVKAAADLGRKVDAKKASSSSSSSSSAEESDSSDSDSSSEIKVIPAPASSEDSADEVSVHSESDEDLTTKTLGELKTRWLKIHDQVVLIADMLADVDGGEGGYAVKNAEDEEKLDILLDKWIKVDAAMRNFKDAPEDASLSASKKSKSSRSTLSENDEDFTNSLEKRGKRLEQKINEIATVGPLGGYEANDEKDTKKLEQLLDKFNEIVDRIEEESDRQSLRDLFEVRSESDEDFANSIDLAALKKRSKKLDKAIDEIATLDAKGRYKANHKKDRKKLRELADQFDKINEQIEKLEKADRRSLRDLFGASSEEKSNSSSGSSSSEDIDQKLGKLEKLRKTIKAGITDPDQKQPEIDRLKAVLKEVNQEIKAIKAITGKTQPKSLSAKENKGSSSDTLRVASDDAKVKARHLAANPKRFDLNASPEASEPEEQADPDKKLSDTENTPESPRNLADELTKALSRDDDQGTSSDSEREIGGVDVEFRGVNGSDNEDTRAIETGRLEPEELSSSESSSEESTEGSENEEDTKATLEMLKETFKEKILEIAVMSRLGGEIVFKLKNPKNKSDKRELNSLLKKLEQADSKLKAINEGRSEPEFSSSEETQESEEADSDASGTDSEGSSTQNDRSKYVNNRTFKFTDADDITDEKMLALRANAEERLKKEQLSKYAEERGVKLTDSADSDDVAEAIKTANKRLEQEEQEEFENAIIDTIGNGATAVVGGAAAVGETVANGAAAVGSATVAAARGAVDLTSTVVGGVGRRMTGAWNRWFN